MAEPRSMQINGRETLVVSGAGSLPRRLPDLLSAMEPFGFSYREDFSPSGATIACMTLHDHRLALIREGRWLAPFGVSVNAGVKRAPDGSLEPIVRRIGPGVFNLRLEMCRDCGAVCVRDVTQEKYAGARPTRLTNRETGQTRVVPAVASRNLVLGWYSGKRPNGREYR